MHFLLAEFVGGMPSPRANLQQVEAGITLGWRLLDAAFRTWIPLGLDDVGMRAEAQALRILPTISSTPARASLRSAEAARSGKIRSAVTRAMKGLDTMALAELRLAEGDLDAAMVSLKAMAKELSMCAFLIGHQAMECAHELVDRSVFESFTVGG